MLTNILRILLGHQLDPFTFVKSINYIPDLNVTNLGIYVHIPFCRTLCPFCPYYKTKFDMDKSKSYLDALLKEIDTVSVRSFESRREVTSIYFGGGSPALMDDGLHKIILHIKKYFDIIGNTGIELHPRDVTHSSSAKIVDAGFDMVSLGVQSFSDSILAQLGRTYHNPEKSLVTLSKNNFKAIDVDLIFGIPGQQNEDLRKDFLIAAEKGATQISTYPFIDFSYAKNERKPLSHREKKRLLKTLLKTSEEAGFERTSVWTFAKAGTPKYSSITRDNFLGFGPSAATLGKKNFKVNTFSVDDYIKSVNRKQIPTALRMKFNERTRSLYWLFWNCYNGELSDFRYEELFDRSLNDDFGKELLLASKMGLLTRERRCWRLTERGSYLFHLAEQIYTHQYIDKTWNSALKNPWPEKIELM